ncbi:MAG: hypothetical protein IJ549_01030 [Prevotella sp.]|nr:hypothetical protein [Prevotella sp.]
MKNWIKSMFAVICGMMIMTGFTSCGGDDDNGSGSGTGGGGNSGTTTLWSMLVGNAWYEVYEGSDLVEVELYLFNSDGTADAAELKRRSSDGYKTTRGERFKVNYSIVDNRLTIVESDGDTRVSQLDITDGSTTTMRPIKSDGTLGEAETIYLLAKGKTADQLIDEGLIEQLMDRLTAARRQ